MCGHLSRWIACRLSRVKLIMFASIRANVSDISHGLLMEGTWQLRLRHTRVWDLPTLSTHFSARWRPTLRIHNAIVYYKPMEWLAWVDLKRSHPFEFDVYGVSFAYWFWYLPNDNSTAQQRTHDISPHPDGCSCCWCPSGPWHFYGQTQIQSEWMGYIKTRSVHRYWRASNFECFSKIRADGA